MSTCNRSDLQTLGSQPVIMPKNLPPITAGLLHFGSFNKRNSNSSCVCVFIGYVMWPRDLVMEYEMNQKFGSDIYDVIRNVLYHVHTRANHNSLATSLVPLHFEKVICV